jgi:hypothetical protein
MTADPNADRNAQPPFAKHRRYYLFIKAAIVLFTLWLVLHFSGVL